MKRNKNKNIFKNDLELLNINKEEMDEIKSLPFFAVDNFITAENNLQDDHISLWGEYAIISTPKASEGELDNFIYNKEVKMTNYKSTFKKSGDIYQDYGIPELIEEGFQFFKNRILYFIKIRNPEIIYRTEIYDCDLGNKVNANSRLEKEEAVRIMKGNSNLFEFIVDNMKSNKYFQDGNVKKDCDIDKIVRFCNSAINKKVRKEVEKYISDSDIRAYQHFEAYFDDIMHEIGASSPKRNIIHAIATLNDIRLLTNYISYNLDELLKVVKKEKMEVKEENLKYLKLLLKNKYKFKLKFYNYYEDIVGIYQEEYNLYMTFETERTHWYDEYSKDEVIPTREVYELLKDM